jgi:hypothetical protein
MADTNMIQFLRFIVASGVESTLNRQRLFTFSFFATRRYFAASKTISSSSFFIQAMSLGQLLSKGTIGVELWQMTAGATANLP